MTTSKLSKAPMTCSKPDLNMSDSRIGHPIKSKQLNRANYMPQSGKSPQAFCRKGPNCFNLVSSCCEGLFRAGAGNSCS